MIKKLPLIFFLTLSLISSCTGQHNKNQKNPDPYFCSVNSDRVVKDVHNCCGYYPKCVNKDYIPNIASVEKECKEKGIVSICGFAEVKECRCEQNKCVSVEGNLVV